jgi:TolB-like protein
MAQHLELALNIAFFLSDWIHPSCYHRQHERYPAGPPSRTFLLPGPKDTSILKHYLRRFVQWQILSSLRRVSCFWECGLKDIFLSYNREDASVAQRFADAFKREGMTVWWDIALRSGEAYDEVTEDALRSAKAVVVLWSPRSVVSRWVRAEATLANRNKTLVPVMIEPCERPIMFELTQTADLIHWDGRADDAAWLGFLEDVRRFVGREVLAKIDAAPQPASMLALPDKPSIAVMPFTNLSGEPEQAYFVDGLMEEVVTSLTRIRTIFVIASGSSLSLRGQGLAPAEVGGKLGVRYVLEGSVRKAGNRVRISVKLIDAPTGEQIWADRFDGGVDDIFALQDEVAMGVAGILEFSLQAAETKLSARRPTEDLRSYDLYLQALVKHRTYVRENVFEALALLDRAIELDPTYALALSLAAGCHTCIMQYQWSDNPAEHHAALVDLIERSVRYGRDDPEVLATAAISNWLSGNKAAGEPLAIRSVKLNPGSSWSLMVRGWFAYSSGELELADRCLTDSMRLDPLSPNRSIQLGGMAATRFAQRRFEEALQLSIEEVQLVPQPLSLGLLTAIHGQLGHISRSAQALQTLRRITPMTGEDIAKTLYQTSEHQDLFLQGFHLADVALEPA